MKNENDQPNRESKRPNGESDKHQPAEDAKSIKQLPVVFPVDHARMDRALIHLAAVRIRYPTAHHHRSHWSQCHCQNRQQRESINDPRKSLGRSSTHASRHLVLLQVRRNPCELGEGGLKIVHDLVPTAGNYVISTSRSRSSPGGLNVYIQA